jgi:tRNA threonylcarbamoyladenosine biosynthesis protein TsaB
VSRSRPTAILAFDAATSSGAVCAFLGAGGGAGWRAQTSAVASLIDDCVDDPKRIEGIVVGRGPGSFTSIRIALATARGLALGLDVPVAGVSTLDAFARGVPVIDARRGEVFTLGPRVCRPDELDVAGKVLVGDGAVRYRELFEAAGATIPDDPEPHRPDPYTLAEHAGTFGAAEAVEPIYVRAPDAKARQR